MHREDSQPMLPASRQQCVEREERSVPHRHPDVSIQTIHSHLVGCTDAATSDDPLAASTVAGWALMAGSRVAVTGTGFLMREEIANWQRAASVAARVRQ